MRRTRWFLVMPLAALLLGCSDDEPNDGPSSPGGGAGAAGQTTGGQAGVAGASGGAQAGTQASASGASGAGTGGTGATGGASGTGGATTGGSGGGGAGGAGQGGAGVGGSADAGAGQGGAGVGGSADAGGAGAGGDSGAGSGGVAGAGSDAGAGGESAGEGGAGAGGEGGAAGMGQAGGSGGTSQAGTGGAADAGAGGASSGAAGATAGTGGAAGATAGAGGASGGAGAGGGSNTGGSPPASPWVTVLSIETTSTVYGANVPSALATDSNGNVLVAGTVSGVFAGGVLDTNAAMHGVVVKLDPAGKLLWAHDLGGVGVFPKEIAADAAGNPVVVGTFHSIDVGQGPVTGAQSPYGVGLFAASLSAADGSLRWGRTWGEPAESAARPSVSISPLDGDIVIIGSVGKASTSSGIGPMGPGLVELHLDGLGQTTTAVTFGASGLAYVRHKPNGNRILGGTFSTLSSATPVSFGTGGQAMLSPTFRLFLAELTPGGANVQTRTFDSPTSTGRGDLAGLAVGPSGVSMIGDLTANPPDPGTDLGSGTAYTGPFAASFDSQYAWIWDHPFKPVSQPLPGGYIVPMGVAFAAPGTTLVAGQNYGMYDIGGFIVTKASNTFLASYSSTGAIKKVSTYSSASVTSVAGFPDSSVLFTGVYTQGANFGTGALDGFGWAVVSTTM